METQPPQSHFSFSRFSDLIRDSTKRGKTPTTTTTTTTTTSSYTSHPSQSSHTYTKSIPFLETLDLPSDTPRDQDLRDRRRSSVANYTDRVRQMFTPSPHTHPLPPKKIHLTHLPPEILTAILHYLPFYDLLRCQLIAPLFRSLIPGSSPLLAEALYLKPSRGLQIYACIPATFDLDFDVAPRSVERGVQPEGTRFSVGVRREFSLTRRCMGLIRMSEEIVFHPVVMEFNLFMERPERFWAGAGAEGKGSGGGSGGGSVASGSGRGEPEGGYSWRDMLLSMPPLREVRLRHAKNKTVYRVLRVSEEGGEGVTLGDLFEALGEWSAE